MRKSKIYIVIVEDLRCSPTDFLRLMIGYLPLSEIPKTSFLRKKLFEENTLLALANYGALRGLYHEKKLAQEHARLERKWRNDKGRHNKVRVVEIQ